MTNLELVQRRMAQGHRVRFYQDFYGRERVKVLGGLMFWRTGFITLTDDEIVEVKKLLSRRRMGRPDATAGEARTLDAA